MSKRFVLEGEWSGYTSSQRRVAHRQVITRPERYDGIKGVIYTDNTTLSIRIRPCKPREKVVEMNGYGKLLDDIIASGKKGYVSVADLRAKAGSAP